MMLRKTVNLSFYSDCVLISRTLCTLSHSYMDVTKDHHTGPSSGFSAPKESDRGLNKNEKNSSDESLSLKKNKHKHKIDLFMLEYNNGVFPNEIGSIIEVFFLMFLNTFSKDSLP